MKVLNPKQPQTKSDWLNSLLVIVMLMSVVLGCRTLTSNARGRMSNLNCSGNVGFVNGQLDAGVNVIVTVTNVGESGFINIKSEINTSEGEWSRSQDLQFNAGETKTLTYFFNEPTINVTNIQCRVVLSPNAE